MERTFFKEFGGVNVFLLDFEVGMMACAGVESESGEISITVFSDFLALDAMSQEAVLYHEMGHIVLGHIHMTQDEYVLNHERIEAEADAYAARCMPEAADILASLRGW